MESLKCRCGHCIWLPHSDSVDCPLFCCCAAHFVWPFLFTWYALERTYKRKHESKTNWKCWNYTCLLTPSVNIARESHKGERDASRKSMWLVDTHKMFPEQQQLHQNWLGFFFACLVVNGEKKCLGISIVHFN